MKSKNGFTLIELLAVIVILAIIALIATPIVLNIIEKARAGAAKASAYGLIDGIRVVYAESLLDGNLSTSGNAADISLSGNKPTAGTWSYSEGEILITGVVFDGYTCTNVKEGKLTDMTCTKN